MNCEQVGLALDDFNWKQIKTTTNVYYFYQNDSGIRTHFGLVTFFFLNDKTKIFSFSQKQGSFLILPDIVEL